ncbi:MAG: HEAT repeat domain-containing protein [Verrucomicrobiales bacterium]|nr:HEAT repeat domain-containing protein [Verrucomicrobiales bacterium]
MKPGIMTAVAASLTLLAADPGRSQVAPGQVPKPPPGFEIVRWARQPMLRSPVALSFDDQGRLYIAETARRSTVDIDIRGHPDWLIDDLSNQSVDDLREFFRRRMAPEFSTINASWLRDYNEDGSHDWRDLTAVRERIDLLQDSDGDGLADQAQVFAEGFNEEINGVVAGVLPWQDDVFVTIYPDLWRLRDENRDGVADRQESIFRGFGVHAAFDGHDLHGLIVGPDGKIYFSIGDNGFSVTNREGRRLHHPNTGGVLRMNPDGTELEVFATGLRNPQEIAFDELGNLFTVDNDGDLADERERFVFIAEGSDSGWRLHWQFRESGWARYTGQPTYNPWIDERLWVPHFPGQPAHILPPISNYSIGPGSFQYNPGTALTDAYRGHFFLIQYPVAKVTAFQARPKGAGFEMANEHTFVSGMMASCLAFSPDGALFIGDWDGMWAPSGKGSIWRVDDPTAAKSAMRAEVRDRLRQGARDQSIDDLLTWLAHADLRVRQRAQFELVRRGRLADLRTLALATRAPWIARLHAIRGLGQSRAIRAATDLPLSDADPRIRAQSARIAGEARLAGARDTLILLLDDTDASVRFQAAIALGKLRDATAFPALVHLLDVDNGADPFLRHAGIMGLAGAASPTQLATLARHANPQVRIAAVVALRRQHAVEARDFLSDAAPLVYAEAVRSIHDDDGIAEAIPALAAEIAKPVLPTDPGLVRRLLNANLQLGSEEASRRLASYATNRSHPGELRAEALECLADWSRTPALDRVQGFMRHLGPRDAGLGHARIQEHFDALAGNKEERLMPTLVRVVLDHGLPVEPSYFVDWLNSESQPARVRVAALSLLALRSPELFPAALRQSLASPLLELRLAARRLQSTLRPDEFMGELEAGWSRWPIAERQLAISLAVPITGPVAASWFEQRLSELATGQLKPDLELDVLEAAARRPEERIRATMADIDSRRPAQDPLAGYRPTLRGGNPDAGRDIFKSHANAQCVRCHEGGGEGKQVGPVLADIGSRVDAEYLLESLIQPSARIADGFATTMVTLRNGDEFDGVRLSDTNHTLLLRLSTGAMRRMDHKDIAHQVTSTVSAMPPMGEVLTRFEIRDLIAYLQSLRQPEPKR